MVSCETFWCTPVVMGHEAIPVAGGRSSLRLWYCPTWCGINGALPWISIFVPIQFERFGVHRMAKTCYEECQRYQNWFPDLQTLHTEAWDNLTFELSCLCCNWQLPKRSWVKTEHVARCVCSALDLHEAPLTIPPLLTHSLVWRGMWGEEIGWGSTSRECQIPGLLQCHHHFAFTLW